MSVSERQGEHGSHGHCRKIHEDEHKTVYRCKGSDKNGGREIDVTYDKSTKKTHTTDSARADYEHSHHTHLDKDTDVDHKDNNKENNRSSNLQAMSHSDNVAKENKHRAGE